MKSFINIGLTCGGFLLSIFYVLQCKTPDITIVPPTVNSINTCSEYIQQMIDSENEEILLVNTSKYVDCVNSIIEVIQKSVATKANKDASSDK